MSDLVAILVFTWVPLVGAFAFSLTATPLGALLSLRDEILLGVALPPVGSAAIVASVLFGVSPDNTLALYFSAVVAILIVSLALPAKGRTLMSSVRWRAALLASVFCAGEAATILMSAVSTNVEAHIQHMLRGELLAIGGAGLVAFGLLTATLLVLGYRFRGVMFALGIDEEGLVIRLQDKGRYAILVFRTVSAILIAAGVIWVGPLLTLGLLAVPTMIWERHARSLAGFFAGVIVIGGLSVLLGFAVSIVLDLPPVPVVICALFAIGGVFVLLARH
ncbi:MAG: metal ABC transporter permease [Candidatus Latescibacterota bacterium]|nr:MAG: metal ABC transporter permease [Candidatus Latescibacterota bacterium]